MKMKPENEMTDEVRRLLESLEEHGKNAHRQQQLSDLIDGLSEKEVGTKRRKIYPIWWAVGAAAAVLLLWLLARPSAQQVPNTNEEFLVEGTIPVDSIIDEMEEPLLEEPMIEEMFLAEETPLKQTRPQPVIHQKPNAKFEKPSEIVVEKPERIGGEEMPLAESTSSEPTENIDTANIGSNTITPVSETPSTVQSPQRRVIRSLNLVCYECPKEPENWPTNNSSLFTLHSSPETTLFGQAQDPNMKNGAMTFELKLN